MSERLSDLRRVVAASGTYAAAALAQRGLAFLLLPIYTRFIDPVEYGKLELLTVFSTIVFGCLGMGLPSAIVKCYHRDAATPEEQAKVLMTASALGLPVIVAGAGALIFSAPAVGRILVGTESTDLVRLVLVTGAASSLIGFVLSTLRAQERAFAFSALGLLQFIAALVLNILLVVKYGMGVRGVLWGNLVSTTLTLPLAMAIARHDVGRRFARPLVWPLLRFGLLLIPVVLSGWVINMSDRYVLRLFRDLAEVAVYGVGYKFGMLVELLVVWPFQLAWPAISFSISHREGHRETYAKVLTYLSAILAYLVVALALLTRVLVPAIVGAGYELAYKVVPLVSLAYAFNGIHYCLAPGVHIVQKTKYITFLSIGAAVLNLALNFLLIPKWGMMGAAWATVLAYLLVAVLTGVFSQRMYGVEYEHRRLAKIVLAGVLVWLAGVQVSPELSGFSIGWHVLVAGLGFPVLLVATGFFLESERLLIKEGIRRCASYIRR